MGIDSWAKFFFPKWVLVPLLTASTPVTIEIKEPNMGIDSWAKFWQAWNALEAGLEEEELTDIRDVVFRPMKEFLIRMEARSLGQLELPIRHDAV